MVVSLDRWLGKVAVVTGASSGIGAAVAKELVENGVVVAGLARRKDRLTDLAKSLSGKKGQFHPVQCDMTNEKEITDAFEYVIKNLGPIHILINNAGVVATTPLDDSGDVEKWRQILDTNVLGLSIATKEAIKNMKANKIDGHIININSIAGQAILPPFPGLNIGMYSASKHAVTALTAQLANELTLEKSKIKITSISPGAVATEILQASGQGKKLEEMKKQMTNILDSEDIANTVVFALSTPPHVQIQEISVKPVGEMYF